MTSTTDRKEHWDQIYLTRQPHEVSWTEAVPETSLRFIRRLDLPKTAKVIDVGGGDSRLADHLLEEGFTNITVLDISAAALDRAKKRLGSKAGRVTWIVSDIIDFEPGEEYDLWHDRAVFHFLTDPREIDLYIEKVTKAVRGYLVLATFSEHGPEKCSGLPVQRYGEAKLRERISGGFAKLESATEDHRTPFGTLQNFLYCSFKRVKR